MPALLHVLTLIFLISCFIGALLWVVIDGIGVTASTYHRRVAAGERPRGLHVMASIVVAIVAWPIVARELIRQARRHPQQTALFLKRTLWSAGRK